MSGHSWSKVVPPAPDPLVVDSIHAKVKKTMKKIAKSGVTVDRGFLNRIRSGIGSVDAIMKGGIVDVQAGTAFVGGDQYKIPSSAQIRLKAGRQAGKSLAFGQMYGHSPSALRGEHWRCSSCGLDHWSDEEPPRHALEVAITRVEGQVHYDLPLFRGRLSAMPAMRYVDIRSCDEELVRDVMES